MSDNSWVPDHERLNEIKRLLEAADDRIGPDSSLRWLIGEVDRLTARHDNMVGELRVLQTLLEKIVTRLGEGFIINPISIDPLELVNTAVYRHRGIGTELAKIHDLAAEALGYTRAPTAVEDPNCPCPEQFITGDHTSQTLVMELIKKYKDQQLTINNLSHQVEVVTKEAWKINE